MKIELKKIGEIKTNPKNPRVIKDEKYKKLVQSIKEFPEMLEIRPIVVDKDFIVLGGNMRLKACKEAGLEEIPVICAESLTPQQQKEFIIKDNVSFGQWDWKVLNEEWDNEFLSSWGMDVLQFGNVEGLDQVNYESEWVGMPEFKPKDEVFKLIINFESEQDMDAFCNEKEIEVGRKGGNTWATSYPFAERKDWTSLRFDRQ